MARMRTIKPGFFTNDQLAEIEPLGRLLFAGLWTMADREGRLEDRPKRIKAELLPYDDCNADGLLSDLEQGGFIIRYEVAGHRYIQVSAFSKHQCPNVKELASTIPQPPEKSTSCESTIPAQCQDSASISLIGTEQNRTGTETVLLAENKIAEPQPSAKEASRNYQKTAAAATAAVRNGNGNLGQFDFTTYENYHRAISPLTPDEAIIKRARFAQQNGKDDDAVKSWQKSKSARAAPKQRACACDGSGFIFKRNGVVLTPPEECTCQTKVL